MTMTTLFALCGLMIISAVTSVQAQTVNWTKTLDFDLAGGHSVSYVSPTSGSTTGPTVSGVQIGYDLAAFGQRDTLPTEVFGVFTTTAHFVELTLTFDHLLDGGSLAGVGTLQYVTDYEISISGGTGTLTNQGVQYLYAGTSIINPLGTYTGDGTSTIHFNSPPLTPIGSSSSDGWSDYYSGQLGLAVTGTYDTVTIRRYNTDFTPGGLQGYDDVAGLTVSGATVIVPVPEPSGALLLGLTGTLALLRRRR
jgi:hypothetical protein